ncbi:MAG: flagellar protein FlgN [Castellaniella sp.]|uniref:flagella synthesis protein FlgN n=1 Tax=Castellaniella sp. TaxID=1955812 RepID=UPI002A369DDB|nr:flagellar protein FlgN [Castellaniella sp.]MDY0309815.1 flagellar protein FlgN [Castellaniella sp.]
MNPGDTLLQCIQAQSGLLDEFIQALEAESAALLDNPTNLALAELTLRKNDYAQRLAQLDQERARILNDLDQADDADGIDAVCAVYPELRASFDALFERADRAHRLNQDNGQVLRTFMEHNQRALDTLHALINQDLYDARGRLRRP